MGWINWGNWNDWGEWCDVARTVDVLHTRYGENTEIITAVAAQIPVAMWLPTSGHWQYDCGLQSVGKVQLRPEAPPYQTGWGSYLSTIEIEKNSADDEFNFGYNNTFPDQRYGAYPHDGESSTFDNVIGLLALLTNLAVSRMNSYVSFGIAAAQLIILLLGGPDNLDENLDRMSAEFIYDTPYAPESGCWYNWFIGANANAYVSFTLEYLFYGMEMLPRAAYGIGCWIDFQFTAPPPPSEILASGDKENYGLIEINASDIENKASEYGLSKSIVKEHIKSKEPLYIITKPEVEIKPFRLEKTKKLSKEEIDTLTAKAEDM